MTFKELAYSRITQKFRDKPNFKNILTFLVGFFDDLSLDIDILKNERDMSSDNTIVLDELGKILGVYPRPSFATSITGIPTVFAFDVTPWDTLPFASLEDFGIRPLTNAEYSRLLKATSRLTSFKGTMQDWEDLISDAVDANVFLTNKASSFDIIVLKDLGTIEKYIAEFILTKNNLTVSRGFLGTTSGDIPFTFDVTPFDIGAFIKQW